MFPLFYGHERRKELSAFLQVSSILTIEVCEILADKMEINTPNKKITIL